MQLTPAFEIKNRIRIMQEQMQRKDIDAVLVMQSADLFYFSGTFQNAFLYIPLEGEPVLMVKRHLQRALETSPLRNIIALKSTNEISSVLREYGLKDNCTLGLEMDVLPVALYNKIKSLFPQSDLTDCSTIIRKIRSVKSPYEIGLIKNVAGIVKAAFELLPGLIKEGKTEIEIAGLFEAEMRKRGHQGLVRVRGFNQDFFFGCFLAGESGGVGSYFDGPLGGPGLNPGYPIGPGKNIISPNQPIIVDYVGAVDGYLVDVTRVFSIGKLPLPLEDAHKLAIEIKNEIIKQAVPGTPCSDLYNTALRIAGNSPYKDNFLGFGEPVKFIGHGVGIELNELPVLSGSYKGILQEGMVVAVEPKFIFPGKGAVGIENTFLVDEKGLVNLTNFEENIVVLG